MQTQVAVTTKGVSMNLRFDGLAEPQVLEGDLLLRRLRCVDVENKIGTLGVDLVVEGELEFDFDHIGAQYAGKLASPLWACAQNGRLGTCTIGNK